MGGGLAVLVPLVFIWSPVELFASSVTTHEPSVSWEEAATDGRYCRLILPGVGDWPSLGCAFMLQ